MIELVRDIMIIFSTLNDVRPGSNAASSIHAARGLFFFFLVLTSLLKRKFCLNRNGSNYDVLVEDQCSRLLVVAATRYRALIVISKI